MKRGVLLLVVAVLPASAQARIFTNTEGKSIEAEIVRASDSKVTLRLEDKRTATIKLSTLSEEDRDYVRQWLADRLPRLRVTPNMVRSSKKEKYSSYSRSYYYHQSYELSVEFRNEENVKGLEDTSIKYILVGRNVRDPSRHKIMMVQEQEFSVPPGGKHTVRFRKVLNKFYQSSYSKSGYKIFGYVIYAERKKDQREVYAYGSAPQLKDAIYTIVGLETGDYTDKHFQKPQRRQIDLNRDPLPRRPQRRPGNPAPAKPPEEPPIIIR